MKQAPKVTYEKGSKLELTASEACHRLALSEGQKENEYGREMRK